MATPAAVPGTRIRISVFDSTKELFPDPADILVTVRDGEQRQILREFVNAASLSVPVPVQGNLADNYAVLASAKGHKQAGFYPVKVSSGKDQQVDIMLVPKRSQFNFAKATWKALDQSWPDLKRVLQCGTTSDTAASARYSNLMETGGGAALACLLNICEALRQIHLPRETAFDYLREFVFARQGDARPPAADRFFAWTDPALIEQIKQAANQSSGPKVFEPAPYTLHPGATSSWKQVQFGEANVQFTFHENQTDNGRVLLELDMDYYRDLGAHFVLEVAVNGLTNSVTDPKDVYVLRWLAGRRAGVPEFDPPYTIERA
jgi:hypothetical protein